jgi:hypothetical protein
MAKGKTWAAGPQGRAASKVEGGMSMGDTGEISTVALWRAIRRNADLALHHLDWEQYLKNIKVLCEWIEMRVEVFQKQTGSERVMKEHGSETGLNDQSGSRDEAEQKKEKQVMA